MRLIDRVDMPVAPVVRGLRHATDDGARQKYTQEHQRGIVGPDPGADDAAEIGPHRREPGDRLDQFEHGPRVRDTRGRGWSVKDAVAHNCKL